MVATEMESDDVGLARSVHGMSEFSSLTLKLPVSWFVIRLSLSRSAVA